MESNEFLTVGESKLIKKERRRKKKKKDIDFADRGDVNTKHNDREPLVEYSEVDERALVI